MQKAIFLNCDHLSVFVWRRPLPVLSFVISTHTVAVFSFNCGWTNQKRDLAVNVILGIADTLCLHALTLLSSYICTTPYFYSPSIALCPPLPPLPFPFSLAIDLPPSPNWVWWDWFIYLRIKTLRRWSRAIVSSDADQKLPRPQLSLHALIEA